jgi:hypothetical protein
MLLLWTTYQKRRDDRNNRQYYILLERGLSTKNKRTILEGRLIMKFKTKKELIEDSKTRDGKPQLASHVESIDSEKIIGGNRYFCEKHLNQKMDW